MRRIAVIGAGSWGTALSIIAGRKGHSVRLWGRDGALIDELNKTRENAKYLPGFQLSNSVTATSNLEDALEKAQIVILAAPSHAIRELFEQILPNLPDGVIIVGASKGIEVRTGYRISQVLQGVGGNDPFVCLSGPSFAREVVAGHPTAIAAASEKTVSAEIVQEDLSFENLRIYTNDDLVGTELGGCHKNIVALAAGMVTGLGFGANTLAALITRGLAEMSRLALAQGAQMKTLMGLAGLGDLVLTCTGALSRNRAVGEELGRGRQLDDILNGMNGVAEGIKTTDAAKKLAQSLGVEMPIAESVYQVLYGGLDPKSAVTELMARPLRGEFESQRV